MLQSMPCSHMYFSYSLDCLSIVWLDIHKQCLSRFGPRGCPDGCFWESRRIHNAYEDAPRNKHAMRREGERCELMSCVIMMMAMGLMELMGIRAMTITR